MSGSISHVHCRYASPRSSPGFRSLMETQTYTTWAPGVQHNPLRAAQPPDLRLVSPPRDKCSMGGSFRASISHIWARTSAPPRSDTTLSACQTLSRPVLVCPADLAADVIVVGNLGRRASSCLSAAQLCAYGAPGRPSWLMYCAAT